MGYQTAQALALMDKMNLEQQIKNHLLGNFYPRHDVRLVPIAVQALEIYRDNNSVESSHQFLGFRGWRVRTLLQSTDQLASILSIAHHCSLD